MITVKKNKLIIEINIGDTIYTGRFKNKKTIVKSIDVDPNGQPIVNKKTILKAKVINT